MERTEMGSGGATSAIEKRPTGIAGLDALSYGGLPRGGATLVSGEAGAGKTILALQVLANAARAGERGVFVAFEEPAAEVVGNARSFDWELERHVGERLRVLDARPPEDVAVAGGFDIAGLLAVLEGEVARGEPAWLVFDGIDQLLGPSGDPLVAAREVQRLQGWLGERGLTALLTAKRSAALALHSQYLESLQFMLSTVIELSAEVVDQRLDRELRIVKYRGSPHVTDQVPLVIDGGGIRLPYYAESEPARPGTRYYGDDAAAEPATTERVGSGVPRLDTLVGGGYFRGSSTLISGAPGTSKTSLAAAFAAAAAERGERAVLVSFDEEAAQIVRNVASVGIDLQRQVDAGRLRIASRQAWSAPVERHYLEIVRMLDDEQPRCLVIDPISALLKGGDEARSHHAIERLLGLIKARGITVVMTSLLEPGSSHEESTAARVSTIADVWLVLDYHVRYGERNRALSIVKARGTRHSNQVRELVLGGGGIDLADVYPFGSEVLMGTARLQKENEIAAERHQKALARERRRLDLERRLEESRARLREMETEVERLRQELALEDESQRDAAEMRERLDSDVQRSRQAEHRPGRGDGGSRGGG